MSRSNPTDNLANPTTRYFEWAGGADGGYVRWYDKSAEKEEKGPTPFGFTLLDALHTVTGWNDASQSRIYANDIRQISSDPLAVKSFKGGVIAEGLYRDIKSAIESAGGHYAAKLYVAYHTGDHWAIGSLLLKGAAAGAWMDFAKQHKAQLYKGGLAITDFAEGKKGSVKFRTPVFALTATEPAANDAALALDRELQAYLIPTLAKHKAAQAPATEPALIGAAPATVTDDDIPF